MIHFLSKTAVIDISWEGCVGVFFSFTPRRQRVVDPKEGRVFMRFSPALYSLTSNFINWQKLILFRQY